MADQLLFRGGNTASVAGSTVSNREIVVDTQTNQIVLGSAKDRTVMEKGTLFVDGNSVGVGISSPQTKIDSIGTIQARQLDDSKGVQISDDGGLELFRNDSVPFIDFKTARSEDFDCRIQQDNNGLTFKTGGQGQSADRFTISSTGNVGVGNTTPDAKIHSYENSDSIKALLFLQNQNGGANVGSQIVFGNSTATFANDRSAYIRSLTSGAGQNGNHLTFGTNKAGFSAAEAVRIDIEGRTLLGTSTAPTTGVAHDAILTISDNTNKQNVGWINLQNTASISSNFGLGGIVFSGSGSSGYPGAYIKATADANWTSTSYPTRLAFSTTDANQTSPTDRLTIKSDGTLNFAITSVRDLTDAQASADNTLAQGDVYRTGNVLKIKV